MGVDHHCENQDSSEEDDEESKEDSDCEPDSDSKRKSDESDSDDKWDNETLVEVPESQVKKRRATSIEDSNSDSYSDDKISAEWQLRHEKRATKTPTSRQKVKIASEVERLISVDVSNGEAHDDEDFQQVRSP